MQQVFTCVPLFSKDFKKSFVIDDATNIKTPVGDGFHTFEIMLFYGCMYHLRERMTGDLLLRVLRRMKDVLYPPTLAILSPEEEDFTDNVFEAFFNPPRMYIKDMKKHIIGLVRGTPLEEDVKSGKAIVNKVATAKIKNLAAFLATRPLSLFMTRFLGCDFAYSNPEAAVQGMYAMVHYFHTFASVPGRVINVSWVEHLVESMRKSQLIVDITFYHLEHPYAHVRAPELNIYKRPLGAGPKPPMSPPPVIEDNHGGRTGTPPTPPPRREFSLPSQITGESTFSSSVSDAVHALPPQVAFVEPPVESVAATALMGPGEITLAPTTPTGAKSPAEGPAYSPLNAAIYFNTAPKFPSPKNSPSASASAVSGPHSSMSSSVPADASGQSGTSYSDVSSHASGISGHQFVHGAVQAMESHSHTASVHASGSSHSNPSDSAYVPGPAAGSHGSSAPAMSTHSTPAATAHAAGPTPGSYVSAVPAMSTQSYAAPVSTMPPAGSYVSAVPAMSAYASSVPASSMSAMASHGHAIPSFSVPQPFTTAGKPDSPKSPLITSPASNRVMREPVSPFGPSGGPVFEERPNIFAGSLHAFSDKYKQPAFDLNQASPARESHGRIGVPPAPFEVKFEPPPSDEPGSPRTPKRTPTMIALTTECFQPAMTGVNLFNSVLNIPGQPKLAPQRTPTSPPRDMLDQPRMTFTPNRPMSSAGTSTPPIYNAPVPPMPLFHPAPATPPGQSVFQRVATPPGQSVFGQPSSSTNPSLFSQPSSGPVTNPIFPRSMTPPTQPTRMSTGNSPKISPTPEAANPVAPSPWGTVASEYEARRMLPPRKSEGAMSHFE